MTWRSLVPTIFRNHRDPFRTFPREIDRFFDNFLKRSDLESFSSPLDRERNIFPDMDVLENDKIFQITAELPGLAEEDVKVELNNNFLTISGEKKLEKEERENNYYISERSIGSFYRTVQIPMGIEEGSIKAEMKDGVLKITLPKSTEALAQTKRIEIKKT